MKKCEVKSQKVDVIMPCLFLLNILHSVNQCIHSHARVSAFCLYVLHASGTDTSIYIECKKESAERKALLGLDQSV